MAVLGVLVLGLSTGCTTQLAGNAQAQPDAPAEVCNWLSTAEVQHAFGLSGLTGKRNGPVFDHGVAAYQCVYTDTDGATDAALESADFPASVLSARQLVQNFATAGQLVSGSPGVADASAFVRNLAGTRNTCVVAVRRSGSTLRLVAVIVASTVGPTNDSIVALVRAVFSRHP